MKDSWYFLEFAEIWHAEEWNRFVRRKLFTLEANFNPQNDKVLAKHSEDVPEDMLSIYRRQKPAYVMVWGAVSTTWKSPLSFVKQGAIVNTTVYIDDIL